MLPWAMKGLIIYLNAKIIALKVDEKPGRIQPSPFIHLHLYFNVNKSAQALGHPVQ